MKILLIGGSRFVGPLVIQKLLRNGHTLTVFNRGLISQEYPEQVCFIKGDRNKSFSFRERFDIVIDMCAYNGAQTERAISELKFDFFVHMSTAAVYKKAEVFPLTEESPLGKWPLWGEYGKGKVECEKVLTESKIQYAAVRPVYILGPKNYCNRENFIYARIRRGVPIVLPGSGQALAQFVFAEEVATTLVFLVEGKTAGIFNCAGGEAITLKELAKEMGRIMGREPVLKHNPAADGANFNVLEFPFANESLIVDNGRLKKLGLKFIPLLEGLKRDYESYYRHVV